MRPRNKPAHRFPFKQLQGGFFQKIKHESKYSLTLWSPDEPHSQEVLQVVEKNVFDLEVLLHPDGARTAGHHDEARPVQTDTGQPEWRGGRTAGHLEKQQEKH